jgi:6-phosphogluconolactonase
MSQQTMLYVSCGETQEIVRYVMDPATGALAQMGATPLAEGARPQHGSADEPHNRMRSTGAPLTVNPAGTVLYAATRTTPCCLLSYGISPENGELTQIGAAPIPEGTVYISTDHSGRWLLGAAYHSNCVWIARIGSDGAMADLPDQVVAHIVTPHSVVLHPNNRVVYAGATGMPGIQIFDFSDEDMPLANRSDAPASTPDATPRHLAIDPAGRFLFCMNESSSIVDIFAIGEDGRALTYAHSADLRPADQRDGHGLGADITISKNGRFLYCCERKRGTVNVLSVDQSTGALTAMQSVEVGFIPRSLALDPSGRFFASAIQGDGVVHIHAVSPGDGCLSYHATYETGGTPIWVEFVTLPQQPGQVIQQN